MIFGDGVGASLVRGPYCQLDVGLCDVDVFLHWNSAAEEGAWVGLKPDLQGGTGFNLLRVHFWTPVQRKRVSKRGQKVDPLEIKSGPPWRVQFWSLFGPFNVANLLRRLFQVEADLTSNSCGWNLELFEAHYCATSFCYVCEDQKRALLCRIKSHCFAPISIALRPSRPAWKLASKPAPRCFVLISMVSRCWSLKLALRPASNFEASYKF